jgi:RimJ/RimL family protein N-acetyltransferase
MANTAKAQRTYPAQVPMGDKQITLRLMNEGDRDLALQTLKASTAQDLLFLTFDPNDPQALDYWFDLIAQGKSQTLLAIADGRIAGLANLTFNQVFWQRHMGDIWLLVNREWRNRGLGKLLADEIFRMAREKNLQKLVAQMAADQRGAIQVFENMGFKPEALLTDYVIDQQERTHDLVVMSYDMKGFNI